MFFTSLHPTVTGEMWKVGQKIISNPGVISHPVSNLFSNPIRSGYILIIWMILSVSVYSINQTGISETKVSRRREILTFRFLAKWVIFTLKLYEIPTETRGRFWVRSVRRTSAACADLLNFESKHWFWCGSVDIRGFSNVVVDVRIWWKDYIISSMISHWSNTSGRCRTYNCFNTSNIKTNLKYPPTFESKM